MEDNNKIKIIVIISLIIIVIIASILIKIKNNKYEEIKYDEIFETTETEIDEKGVNKTIKIHISGEVKYNGIIELDEGARIDDAIKIAGGLTENADITKVNLAYELSDGQKLYIPTVGADVSVRPQIENYIITENSEGIIENNELKDEKININTAMQTELETLPGIGPSLAYKIVEYRQQNGKFKAVEDLKNVSGIGESKYNQIEKFVEIK